MTDGAASTDWRDRRFQLLLVEDDASEMLHIRELLLAARGARFEVTPAASVDAAMAEMQRRTFDVVLVDLGRFGFGALERLLRCGGPGEAAPAVALSQEHDKAAELRSLRLGAQDHLTLRELSSDLLVRSLLYAAERHRMLRELTLARERERFLARHDGLTGLPNRASLQEHLRRALGESTRTGRKLAVLFIDVDSFKAINDSLGHGIGDEVLRIAARRLGQAVRDRDLVARLGGDEFVVVIRDADDSYALAAVTENIQHELAKPFQVAGREWRITASIGIAIFPRDGRTPEPLIRSADTAMYHAKARGPNQFFFYQDAMDQGGGERFQLVNNLHDAIERGELVVHYQPQVDVALRAIVGAEALVRWRHPRQGLISPGDFIAVAEETGMIMPIGEWVLRAACADAIRWNLDSNENFRIAVNVSGRQLGQPGFSQEVACILTETGLPPSRLEVEITETSVMEANETTHNTLASLRKLGATIAMDDFGTGYSSLTLLKDLSVDSLKIDQSFVRGADAGGPEQVIVGGLVEMARRLGLTPIAEGVETREQLQTLYAQGCHHMQGYLFGKPVPADELAEQLRSAEQPWGAELDAAGILL